MNYRLILNLAMPDGGVVVGGDFGKSWMLGQSDPFAKLAVLSSGGNEGGNFDSFLARYDREGNLLWAQSSGLPGNDFPVDLAALDANSFMLLGNRKTGSGFGPYLSRIGMSGEQTKNAPLVSPGAEDLKEISLITWEPPATLRFGEPIEGNYLSARALGKASFQYEINGSTVDTGDMPLFQPGDVNMTARLFRGEIESNTTTVTLTGLKGRPYLKLGFVQNEGVLHLSHEFFGLHPAHLTDLLKLESMAQGMSYERVSQDGNEAIKEASLTVDLGFTGSLEIMGTFEGDKHYEAASRRIVLEMRNGRVFAAGDQGVVRLQVKDLDGWQGDRIVSKGAEAQISATQGFGTNRKFNRWVEFSEENQKLRTARVQSPFNIRTSLLAEEDMTLFAHYNFTFVGTAINGYLAGSRVFLDYNLNGLLDEEEPFGFSTENGGFELEVTEESIQSNDRNGNGMIDPAEGMLVVLEGVDHSSKLPLSISYRAPPNYSVITSISTMVAELVEEGQSMADAESLVVQYLSLPGGIELSSFEPLQEVFKRGEKAQGFTLRATQLSNLLNEGSRFLQMKTGGKLNRVRGAELIVTTLKDKILAQSGRRSAGINEALDLVDSSLLLDVITEAETQAIKETGQIENFVIPPGSSVREELANIQPDIAEIGNTSILNQMVEQVSSANTMLNELNDNPNVDPAAFKALASASQSILDELGETSANTIFEDEVSTLSNISASDSLAALDILNRVTETEALPVNNELPQSISLEKFSLNALEEFSSKAEINVFAPVLTTSEIISPQDLNDELALGKFSAIDPEGKEIIYSIVGENPDFDLDGQSIFSIDAGTGQIQIRDFDDLRLMNRDTLEPIVRVTDLKGLFRDEKVVINLTEWTYLAGRLQLTDLALTLAENLPVGTIVHKFNPADSQGDKIDYRLVSGKGDNDHTLFTLQVDGTLQTNKVFDFESTPSNFEIRVQARDSRNNTAERSFTIQVTDIIVPHVQTGRARILADGSLQFEGTISASGDVGNQLKRGFLFGRNPITDINDPGLSTISAGTGESVTFSTLLESDDLGGGYSFMAFAENQEGINYGVEQEFTLPRITAGDGWTDGMQLGDSDTWWRSDWFGLFYTELYPWIYHQNLGWVFVNVDSTRGAWLYHERLGWVWTMPEIFPSLFMAKRNEWTYVDTTREKTTMYDYINQAWFEPDTPISILGKALPENGGEIKGLGSYYRWDPVTLEAKPAANFNFGGWSGDLSGVQKTHIFEAIRNMELDASFIPLPSPGTSGKEVVSGAAKALDKMDLTETEKKKSMAELLIFGKSKTSGLSIDGSE